MTDEELLALTALANQETTIINSVNQDRLRNNFALAYDDYGHYFYLLEQELKRRGIVE